MEDLPPAFAQIPKYFFESPNPDNCVRHLLSLIPPVWDPNHREELKKQIELTEDSISLVTEELTSRVMKSQNEIFQATDHFVSLQQSVGSSSKHIQAMEENIARVRTKTLDPIVDVL